MSKVDMYAQGRASGLQLALKIVKECFDRPAYAVGKLIRAQVGGGLDGQGNDKGKIGIISK